MPDDEAETKQNNSSAEDDSKDNLQMRKDVDIAALPELNFNWEVVDTSHIV